MIRFSAEGRPIQQGSMKTFNGHIVHTKGKELLAWRALVVKSALAAGCVPLPNPVEITMNFRVLRPKTVIREYPTVAPDLDKYVRNVGDALTKIAFIDDSQIVKIVATKCYSDSPGVDIEIEHLF